MKIESLRLWKEQKERGGRLSTELHKRYKKERAKI